MIYKVYRFDDIPQQVADDIHAFGVMWMRKRIDKPPPLCYTETNGTKGGRDMKNVTTKIPAIIAMLIALFSLGLLITAFIVSIDEIEPEMGVSKSFAFWVYAVLTSILSLIFYFVDAVISVVKAFLRIHPIFNIVLAVMLFGAIPMMLFVGAKLGINIYIYFSYYLAIFVLEIVSIIKHIKLSRIDKISKLEQHIEPQ